MPRPADLFHAEDFIRLTGISEWCIVEIRLEIEYDFFIRRHPAFSIIEGAGRSQARVFGGEITEIRQYRDPVRDFQLDGILDPPESHIELLCCRHIRHL